MKNILYVANGYFVGITNNGIKMKNLVNKQLKYFSFDDVSIIVFDNPRSYFSEEFIRECVRRDVALLFSDEKHSPYLLCETIYGQINRFAVLKKQLSVHQKTKKRLWHKIVVRKIKNQAFCLKLLKKNKADEIESMAAKIKGDDQHNQEAIAAKIYFREMFGENFKRGRYDDLINASLNYGYAIIRMFIRKEIVSHGLEPAFGIKHVSTENPFNLSDDLIEAYRPFVDYYVTIRVLHNDHQILSVRDKQVIVDILRQQCIIDGKVCYLTDAIKITVNSYLSSLSSESSKFLLLPTFIKGGI